VKFDHIPQLVDVGRIQKVSEEGRIQVGEGFVGRGKDGKRTLVANPPSCIDCCDERRECWVTGDELEDVSLG